MVIGESCWSPAPQSMLIFVAGRVGRTGSTRIHTGVPPRAFPVGSGAAGIEGATVVEIGLAGRSDPDVRAMAATHVAGGGDHWVC